MVNAFRKAALTTIQTGHKCVSVSFYKTPQRTFVAYLVSKNSSNSSNCANRVQQKQLDTE